MHVSQKDMYRGISVASRCEGDALEPYFIEGILLRKIRGFIKKYLNRKKVRKGQREEGREVKGKGVGREWGKRGKDERPEKM